VSCSFFRLDHPRFSTSPIREATELLPRDGCTLKDLTGIVDRDECQFIGGGAFGDVYKGTWKDSGDGLALKYPDVAIKVLRSTGSIDPKVITKRIKVCWIICFFATDVVYSKWISRN
jgi:hypothetical protein